MREHTQINARAVICIQKRHSSQPYNTSNRCKYVTAVSGLTHHNAVVRVNPEANTSKRSIVKRTTRTFPHKTKKCANTYVPFSSFSRSRCPRSPCLCHSCFPRLPRCQSFPGQCFQRSPGRRFQSCPGQCFPGPC